MVVCCALGVVGEAAVVCFDGIGLVVDVLVGFTGLRDLGRSLCAKLSRDFEVVAIFSRKACFGFIKSLEVSLVEASRPFKRLGRDVAISFRLLLMTCIRNSACGSLLQGSCLLPFTVLLELGCNQHCEAMPFNGLPPLGS